MKKPAKTYAFAHPQTGEIVTETTTREITHAVFFNYDDGEPMKFVAVAGSALLAEKRAKGIASRIRSSAKHSGLAIPATSFTIVAAR